MTLGRNNQLLIENGWKLGGVGAVWCFFKPLLLVISCDVSTNYIYEIHLLGWLFPWKIMSPHPA